MHDYYSSNYKIVKDSLYFKLSTFNTDQICIKINMTRVLVLTQYTFILSLSKENELAEVRSTSKK